MTTDKIPTFSCIPTDGSIKPSKVGVYKRKEPYGDHSDYSYSYWDGTHWLYFWGEYKEASSKDGISYDQDWDWYDIVEEAKPEKPAFVAMKFRTPTKEINLAVQKKLIDMGYRWYSGGFGTCATAKHIFTTAYGDIGMSSKVDEHPEEFEDAFEVEVILDVKTTVEVSFDVPTRETIVIAGKTYYLDEVVKNISGKEIQP